MSYTRKDRTPRTPRRDEQFRERITSTLEAQDRVLERLESRLEAPVLNGGFDSLVRKMDKIETVTEALSASHEAGLKKIDAIHVAIYDPDAGLYAKTKKNSEWISTANKIIKWFAVTVAGGLLAGLGKMLYDFASGHIHYTP